MYKVIKIIMPVNAHRKLNDCRIFCRNFLLHEGTLIKKNWVSKVGSVFLAKSPYFICLKYFKQATESGKNIFYTNTMFS